MKSVLVTSALVAAFAIAPAWAQQVSPPPSDQTTDASAPQVSDGAKWPVQGRIVSHVVEGSKATGVTVTTTEVVEPVYPARQPNPFRTISPEAQAAVDAGHDNTRALIQAQLDALPKTPPVQATTTIVTTRSTAPAEPAEPG